MTLWRARGRRSRPLGAGRAASRSRRGGPSSCSDGRPTGRRGCAGRSCCSARPRRSSSLLPRMVAAIVAPLVAGTLLLAPDRVLAADRGDRAHRRAAHRRSGEHVRRSAADEAALSGGGFGGGTSHRRWSGRLRRRPAGRYRRHRRTRPTRRRHRRGGGMPGGLGGATTVSSRADHRTDQERRPTTSGSRRRSARTPPPRSSSPRSQAVMSLGGFNGTDPAITLAQFKQLVAAGKIHYFVADGQGFIGSTAANTSTAYAIQQWVEPNVHVVHDRRQHRLRPGEIAPHHPHDQQARTAPRGRFGPVDQRVLLFLTERSRPCSCTGCA